MNETLLNKLRLYQITTIFSVFFALAGFSYNVWRMEESELNNNIRTACFEMLLELAALEQLIYSAHYDDNIIEGSPRKGWVKVGLISDLSLLTSSEINQKSEQLKQTWERHWTDMVANETAVTRIVESIDSVRNEVKLTLKTLE